MIYLDAIDSDGNLVDLKNGSSLRLNIPLQDFQQPMELFYGYDYYQNDTTSIMDSINWKRTYQPFSVKDNPNVAGIVVSQINNTIKRDTTILFDDQLPNVMLDYMTTDTSLKTNIKNDSIILKRFGVSIRQLGWINCDRFYNDPRPKIELIVDLGDNPNRYNTLLVFDNFNSIMPPSFKQGSTIRFFNLPKGEPVRIISLGIKNGRPVTAMKRTVISKRSAIKLNFEEINPDEYRKKLAE
jgi:hypothetical protein